MRILVTGANGQLGNEMQVLAKENPQHTYYFTDVQELDICNKDAVWAYIAEKRIELIVNCAAYTAVDKAEDDSELAYKLNSEALFIRNSSANICAAGDKIEVSTSSMFKMNFLFWNNRTINTVTSTERVFPATELRKIKAMKNTLNTIIN